MYINKKNHTYTELVVVKNLVINAAEKVRHAVVLEHIVDRTSHTFPVGERQRILGVDTVTTAVPVVLTTWTRTGAPSHASIIFHISVVK